MATCTECGGKGTRECPDCRGSGHISDMELVTMVDVTPIFGVRTTPCKKCKGSGIVTCPACKGSGTV